MINQFYYINNFYGLNLTKNCGVKNKEGKHGQVKKAEGQYIFIQWKGDLKPTGPYHPTSELIYLVEANNV